jgi:hypothetical protein
MIVGRLFGWLLFLAGLGVLVWDVVRSVSEQSLHLTALGELWFNLSSSSLNLAQAVVQRYIHPKLWDPVITTVLLWWAVPVFLIPGIVLVVLFRRHDYRVRWSR